MTMVYGVVPVRMDHDSGRYTAMALASTGWTGETGRRIGQIIRNE